MATSLGTILLATDGSPSAAEAARVAGSLAQQSGAALHVVHTWQYVPTNAGLELASRGDSLMYATYEHQATEILAAAVAALREEGVAVAGHHLARARPASGIIATANDIGADLVVMGSRGLGPVRRLLVGSVADEVVHTATRPVLVVRGDAASWPPARIVIGDDGSPAAREAADLAATIGGLCGARGILVHTFSPLPGPFRMADPLIGLAERDEAPTAAPTPQQLRDEAIGQAQRDLAALAVGLSDRFGTPPEVRVLTGSPAESLLAVAEEPGGPALVAVGSRGLGTFQRLRLGSVSTKVLHAVEGPILIVPARQGGAAEATTSPA